jgi:hypothetical protein
MELKNNQVLLQVISSSKNEWYCTYPGFVNLITEVGERTTPFFLTGVGKIVASSCSEYIVGDHVLFIGFADSESPSYLTSVNSILKVDRLVVSVPKDLAVVAQMVYAVGRLNPIAGMNIYLDPTIKYVDLLKKIVFDFGCNPFTSPNALPFFDGAIIINDNSNDKISMTDQSTVIRINGTKIDKTCGYPGQDFCFPSYMVDGVAVPHDFLPLSTNRNLRTAYRLLVKEAKEVSNTVNQYLSSPLSFLEQMRKEFVSHITPGVMSIAVVKTDIATSEAMSLGIAKYILGPGVQYISHRVSGPNCMKTIVFKDGSVADCFAIASNKESLEVELHFDKISISYSKDGYRVFKGKYEIEPNEENKVTSLSSDDEEILVKMGCEE